MMISIASGKGGTGKTTVAANLALSIPERGVQFLDCDVEEPNASIFLKPRIEETVSVSIPVPRIDQEKCDFCGECAKICAYHALAVLPKKVLVFPHLCHGCGGCSLLCPQGAITEQDREIGRVEIGHSNGIEFIHGKLNVGEAMPTPLIRVIKEKARRRGRWTNPASVTVIDAPPGTSCSVIEAIKGSDFCILVTEPTPFGLNDLILAVEVLKKLQVSFGVVINRSSMGDYRVDSYCQENHIPILLRIPFDREIATLYSQGIPIVQEKKEYIEDFRQMMDYIQELLPT
ncbi:MAG TPA: ATP-binding protein [Candidatus Atribacteria bacterium]|nr:ATP-binding protein [Candidatus Atribacteria bacterium]